MTRKQDNIWNERQKITATELKLRNLSLQLNAVSQKLIPHSLVAHFKGVLKNFKRMLLLHPFDEFFCFLN